MRSHYHEAHGRRGASFVVGRDERFDELDRAGQTLQGRLPDEPQVDASVVVNQLIPHPDHLNPVDLWVFLACRLRYAACGLANDLQGPDDSVLMQVAGGESIPRQAFDKGQGLPRGDVDVEQVGLIPGQKITSEFSRILLRRT